MGFLIVTVVLFALMWLLLIRPQRRRQQQQVEMLSNLAIGDEVLTAGGLYGHVRAIGSDDVTLEVAPGTSVRLDKRAVASVIRADEELEEGEEGEEELEEADAADPSSEEIRSSRA